MIPHGPLEFTSLTSRAETLRCEAEIDDPLIAPLPAGSPAGSLVFYDNFGELRRVPLITAAEAERGNFFKRALDSIASFSGNRRSEESEE